MISKELFEACKLWVSNGRRNINIKINNNLKENECEHAIWAYSYDLAEGVFVEKESDLPTEDELKQLKRERAEAILSEL